MYSFSGNSAASAPISTFKCLWAIYIVPGSVYIHECGNLFRNFGILSLLCGHGHWSICDKFLAIRVIHRKNIFLTMETQTYARTCACITWERGYGKMANLFLQCNRALSGQIGLAPPPPSSILTKQRWSFQMSCRASTLKYSLVLSMGRNVEWTHQKAAQCFQCEFSHISHHIKQKLSGNNYFKFLRVKSLDFTVYTRRNYQWTSWLSMCVTLL